MKPGAVVGGDYRIVRPLSAGGMGSVFVAEQISTGRQRAVKLMHPNLVSDARLRERFVQEARISATIESDHVVEVVGAGVDAPTGTPFLAMELLTGEDLAAHLTRKGARSASEAAVILAQLCHGLAAAHARGVVHRDLKPENVFLARSRRIGADLHVKILDFGIAKVVASAVSQATQSMGTPLWMSPEQSDPKGRVSPATDVWALGLIAFRILTGAYYWNAASDSDSSVHALLREVIMDPIEAPSVRVAHRGVRVALPPGFDAWFLRAVARDPGQRFPTAREAFEALKPILLGGGATEELLEPGDFEEVEDLEPELLDAEDAPAIASSGGRPLVEMRAEFERAPRQPRLVREILELARSAGDGDLAWRAASVLAAFKNATPVEAALASAPTRRPVLARPLDDAAWRALLHPDLALPLVDVLAAATAPLSRASASRSGADLQGTWPLEPHTPPSEPLSAVLRAAALLAIPSPRVLVRASSAVPVAVLHGEPPTCVASASFFAILSPPQALFVAARSLARLRPELYAAHFFGTTENLRSLVTSIAQATGRAPITSAESASVTSMLQQNLRPAERHALGEKLDRLLASAAVADLGRTIRGAHCTAARAALLVTGDLGSALRELTRTPPAAGVLTVDEVVDDLLRFWVGERCGAARARLTG